MACHRNSCEIHPVTCDHCNMMKPRRESLAHKVICNSRPSDCQYCKTPMPFHKVANHIDNECKLKCISFTSPQGNLFTLI
jgi:hypothetical protein